MKAEADAEADRVAKQKVADEKKKVADAEKKTIEDQA